MKNLFKLLVIGLLFVSCDAETDDLQIIVEDQFIEYTEDGTYNYTDQIELNPDINSIEARDLSGLDINITIEDSDPYSGKTYQLNGEDQLARVYFDVNGVQTFLSNGTLTVTQISVDEILGEFTSDTSVDNYYVHDMTRNDSIGNPYSHNVQSGKFYFKGSLQ